MGTGPGGYDVNVAGVRITYRRRTIREHPHAEFIICTRRPGKEDVYVARRYGAFGKLYRDVYPGVTGLRLAATRVPRERYSTAAGKE